MCFFAKFLAAVFATFWLCRIVGAEEKEYRLGKLLMAFAVTSALRLGTDVFGYVVNLLAVAGAAEFLEDVVTWRG